MTLEEFENATDIELRARANNCFTQAASAGTGDKPYLYAEAQFYIGEIERRKQGTANSISFWMELLVIVLIIGEIWVTIHEGKEQASLTAAQTPILQNLQSSTKSTADSLAAQMKLQYAVFVNVQFNGGSGLSLFNNSKSEIVFFGIKVGTRKAKSNNGGPEAIAGGNMKSIPFDDFYPGLLKSLPLRHPVELPITIYLKSANGEEYVDEGTFTFVRQGIMLSGSSSMKVRPEKWSTAVTF
jgi:hypothetical protein